MHTDTDNQPPVPSSPPLDAPVPPGTAVQPDAEFEPALSAPNADEASGECESNAFDLPVPDRKRIEEQLTALKKREAELRRELAIADRPELAEAIRQLEASAFSVARADAKLAEGLTKSEQRRQETLAKKIASLEEKRDQLNEQIGALAEELNALGKERLEGFEEQRREAMLRLVAALGAHMGALRTAGIDVAELLPQIGEWMPEIRVVATELAESRSEATAPDSKQT